MISEKWQNAKSTYRYQLPTFTVMMKYLKKREIKTIPFTTAAKNNNILRKTTYTKIDICVHELELILLKYPYCPQSSKSTIPSLQKYQRHRKQSQNLWNYKWF